MRAVCGIEESQLVALDEKMERSLTSLQNEILP